MPRMLDLCCGLGGVSRRFREAGWEVVGVDIAEWVHPDVVGDIRALPLRPSKFDFIWASEPCTQYSRLAQPGLYPNEPAPDLSLAYAVRDIIRRFNPPAWTVENAFWGSIFLLPNTAPHKGSVGEQTHEYIRKAKRAIIPAAIPDAIIAQLAG